MWGGHDIAAAVPGSLPSMDPRRPSRSAAPVTVSPGFRPGRLGGEALLTDPPGLTPQPIEGLLTALESVCLSASIAV